MWRRIFIAAFVVVVVALPMANGRAATSYTPPFWYQGNPTLTI